MNEDLRDSVLVVEDDASLRVALDRILRKHGYGAVLSSTLHEAVMSWRLHRGSIRLAIVDLGLGDEDGLSLVRHLRRRSPETGIVIYAAVVDVPVRRELLRLGVSEVLAKPAAPETIVAAVRRALGA
ncbi:MAG: response regulator [Candidatus Eisenbacteria bacterium]